MAKLKSKMFDGVNKAKERYSFTSDISVTAEGEFRLTIPTELAEIAERLRKADAAFSDIGVSKPLVNHVVSGRVLNTCEALIDRSITDYLTVQETSELVISYGAVTSYAAFREHDGTLHPNGRSVANHAADGDWVGNLGGGTSDTAFRVGLFARVYKLTTYARSSGSNVAYDRAGDGGASDLPLGNPPHA